MPLSSVRIGHPDRYPAIASDEDSATVTAGHGVAGLHHERQPCPGLPDREKVEIVERREKVLSAAVIECVRTYSGTVEHCRGSATRPTGVPARGQRARILEITLTRNNCVALQTLLTATEG